MVYEVFLRTVLNEAAQIARDKFGNVASSTKPEDNNQVLTEADIAIGNHIVAAIQKEYPTHNIIDEEAGVIDKHSTTTWVVDPIDGTSNFAAGTPLFGCMVGVLVNDLPVAGGVALPGFNEIYIAEKGLGATCNGVPVSVYGGGNLKDSLIAYGIDGHQENEARTRREAALLADIILAIRNLRTSNSVFDLMMVAQGRYGAFLNQTSKIWDNVAPEVILTEAGCKVTDFNGLPIDYSNAVERSGDNFTVCAAPPALHGELQQIILSHKDK